MSGSWPGTEESFAIHRRLCGHDPTATADFAAAFLDPLASYLRATYPFVDEHARLTAAEDAILSVIRNPGVYDPTRCDGNLPAFLRMAACGDLANARARERRHHEKRSEDCVELVPDDGNDFEEEGADDCPSFNDPDLLNAIAQLSGPERRVLDLMRDGERRTEVFAAALGLGDQSPDEQRREVKRTKDRIVKRLRRAKGVP